MSSKATIKPCSCKYCNKRIECNESYLRYIYEGEKHSCYYENQINREEEMNENV